MATKGRVGGTRYTPTTDAGLGLVYRLNILWTKADLRCLAGDFDGWNYILDRIYCNLCYRDDLKLGKDEISGEIVKVEMDENAAEIALVFLNRVRKAKKDYFYALKKKDVGLMALARESHYQALMEKDMWLRKFMMELGLYLKEQEYSPATALFGGR
ncbi:MAG: hypothetical protein ACHQ1D_00890 [Nitrososphaerales archaeon]